MASNRTKFAVGLFLVVGTLLAVSAIIWIGMSGQLKSGTRYVVYFDESVQGLDQDSPVKYRGVTIGRVVHIGVAPDGRLVEVVVQLQESLKGQARLVAQLKSVGITGIMFIELDLAGKGSAPKDIKLSFKPPHPVIPSKPSDIAMIFRGLETAFNRIQQLDVEGVVKRLQAILESANRLISDTDVKPVLQRAAVALDNVNKLLSSEKLAMILDSAEETAREARAGAVDARQAFAEARESVTQLSAILKENRAPVREAVLALDGAVKNARDITREGSGLVAGTRESLDDLFNRTSDALRNLDRVLSRLNGVLEHLESHPGGLLFQAPPEPRRIPQ